MSPWLKKITSHVCKVVFFIRHPSNFCYRVFSNVFIISGTKLHTLQTKVDQNLISDPLKLGGFSEEKPPEAFGGCEIGVWLLCLDFVFWYCGFNFSCNCFVSFIWNKNAELHFQLVKCIDHGWLSPVDLLRCSFLSSFISRTPTKPTKTLTPTLISSVSGDSTE